MSETPQEDLSVEDILSSIKNILVDENGAPQENASSEVPSESKTPEPEPIDDILNLDDSMIVDESKDKDESKDQNVSNATSATEPAKEQLAAEPEVTDNTEKDDPINLADSIDIEQTLKMAEDINLDQISVFKDIPGINPEPEKEPASVKEEAIDASANIINNFAKVFAEKRQEQLQTETNIQNSKIGKSVSSAIEGSNISSLVENAIIEQVRICLDVHFEEIASEIIANQTREWLNNNLASIVERTVAKEIERVIAKVGS